MLKKHINFVIENNLKLNAKIYLLKNNSKIGTQHKKCDKLSFSKYAHINSTMLKIVKIHGKNFSCINKKWLKQ